MPIIREVHDYGWRVRLDLSAQVLRIEVPEKFADLAGNDPDAAVPLAPTLPLTEDGIISAATLLLKAKQFDDGLYAAVELAAQEGAGRFAGKAALLRSLAATLTSDPAATDSAAAALVLAACELSGVPVATPPPLRRAVEGVRRAFLGDEVRSKPLGFYTWSPALASIFRQDRLLQSDLSPAAAGALVRALGETPGAWPAYDGCLRLAARLTNPLTRPSLRDAAVGRVFLPPSRSHEVDLVQRLYGDRPVPEGFDLMTELIRRVRAGEIRLDPTEHSGWYDYQTWSLEPLVVPDAMPEAARLEQGKGYRRYLEDLFRAALALARETHAKQLEMGLTGATLPPWLSWVWVTPNLTIEPLPALYLRRAACYRFVRSVLEEAFGPDALRQLHRLTREGRQEANLAEEVAGMEQLFAGAAASACQELGMEPAPSGEEAARTFAAWRANRAADPDVSRDARMMVPVFWDRQRRKTKVWAFLGWKAADASVDYQTEPRLLAAEPAEGTDPELPGALRIMSTMRPPRPPGSPTGPPNIKYLGERHKLAVPVLVEVYVEKLLDRDEFRRHCDRHKSQAAILANLQ
jgi:hypothetical protein